MFSTNAGKIILELDAPWRERRRAPVRYWRTGGVIFMVRIGVMLFVIVAGFLALLALPDMDESQSSALAVPVTQFDR